MTKKPLTGGPSDTVYTNPHTGMQYTQAQIDQMYAVPVPIKEIDAYPGGRQAWIENQARLDKWAQTGTPTGQITQPPPTPTPAPVDWAALKQMKDAGMTPEQIRDLAATTPPKPPASGPVVNGGSEALNAFMEYLNGRAGSANPIPLPEGRANNTPAYTGRTGGPAYGAVNQKGLL